LLQAFEELGDCSAFMIDSNLHIYFPCK